MENDEETVEQKPLELPVLHQLGKLLLGAAAGFLATKLVEKKYEELFASRHRKSTDS